MQLCGRHGSGHGNLPATWPPLPPPWRDSVTTSGRALEQRAADPGLAGKPWLQDLGLSPGCALGTSRPPSLSRFLLVSGVTLGLRERHLSVRKQLGLKPVASPPVGRVRARQLPLAGETTRGPLHRPSEEDSSGGEDLGASCFLQPPLPRSPCLFISFGLIDKDDDLQPKSSFLRTVSGTGFQFCNHTCRSYS